MTSLISLIIQDSDRMPIECPFFQQFLQRSTVTQFSAVPTKDNAVTRLLPATAAHIQRISAAAVGQVDGWAIWVGCVVCGWIGVVGGGRVGRQRANSAPVP